MHMVCGDGVDLPGHESSPQSFGVSRHANRRIYFSNITAVPLDRVRQVLVQVSIDNLAPSACCVSAASRPAAEVQCTM